MITEDKLIAWLVFCNNTWNNDGVAHAPIPLMDEMRRRGWLTSEEPNWEGCRPTELTPKGQAIFDLNAPEYGVETIPEESEA